MSASHQDRNLLFGIVALQFDFIQRDQLISAMNAWVVEKTKPLGDILVAQGALTAGRRALLEPLVEEHVRQHQNDPHLSLAALGSIENVRRDLEDIKDPDVTGSLQRLKRAQSAVPPPDFSTIAPKDAVASRFRILRQHAKGGLGVVFVAHDQEVNRQVALKEIQLQRAQDLDARERFKLEAEITGGLEHPGIVPVYGLGNYPDGRPYYAMRFIKGESLQEAADGFHKAEHPGRDRVERNLALRQLLRRFSDVCNTIEYAHSKGVLHRDLKPGNIMLGKFGETLVVDWGLAKATGRADPGTLKDLSELPLTPASASGSAPTQMGDAIGTPTFMSPEQAAGRIDLLGPATDVYSLGATLYYILTGKAPFHKRSLVEILDGVQKGDFPPPRQVKPEVDAPLEAICLKAMARHSKDRYASAADLSKDLENWIADAPVNAWPEPFGVKARRWLARHRTLAATSVAVLIVALGLLSVLAAVMSNANEKLTALAHDERAAKLAAEDALAREALQKRQRVLVQINALRDAKPGAVPAILANLDEDRMSVLPLLRERYAAEPPGPRRVRLAMALLPTDPETVRAELVDSLLGTDVLAEALLARDILASQKAALVERLWATFQMSEKGKESQRLRAAAALAQYDSANANWRNGSSRVIEDLVKENTIHLGQWSDAFRPIRSQLVPPLSIVFRDPRADRAAERKLAAALLADYAADQAEILSDLLFDADAKQFDILYAAAKEHGTRFNAILTAEIDKKPTPAKEITVFEAKGKITGNEPKVAVSTGQSVPGKRYDIQMKAEKKYRLTMDSEDFDSFLILQSKAAQELAFDDDGGGKLDALIMFIPPSDGAYSIFAASVRGEGAFVLKVIEDLPPDKDPKELLAKRQANAAVALLRMNQPEKVWPILKHSSDPRTRSYLIHRFAPLGVAAETIVKRFYSESDVSIRRALILSMGEFTHEQLSQPEQAAFIEKLLAIYATEADSGLHAAAEWLLRHWGQDEKINTLNAGLRTTEKETRRVSNRSWYINGQDQTMVVIPGPVQFLMGSPLTEAERLDIEKQHAKRIGRTFAIGAKAVTMEQYRKFDKSYQIEARYHWAADLPVVGLNWYQAASYCNWLSAQEGIPENQWCYETNAAGDVIKIKAKFLSLSGYRLPTEAEFEYAARAGAATSRYFGETEELLSKYAWYNKNTQEKTSPVGLLKPNDLGLFDSEGNAFAWCQENYRSYPDGKGVSDDVHEGTALVASQSRVLRGGSFSGQASSLRSAYRFLSVPTNRSFNRGVRVARTLTP